MTAENSPRTPTTAFDTSNEQDVSTLDTLDDDWPTTTPSVDQVEQERAARCLFSIPANEPLLHEAYASCKINSVYFAGRLYIFKRYLSFYTCSFGTDFRKLVPLQRVQAIRRRQHLSQNNALEIKYDDAKYMVLANMQDREGVFRSLLDLWEAANPEACQYYKENVQMQQTWREKKIRKMVGMVGMGSMLPESASIDSPSSVPDDEDELLRTATGLEEYVEESTVPLWKQQWLQSMADLAACPDAQVPPPHKDATVVAQGQGHGSVQDYVKHILFGDFMRRFQESNKSLNVQLSVWQPVDDNPLVLARQMNWTLQKKNAFGSNLLECNQSQRLSLYTQHHVVLLTELSIPAVPYGDYFVVCARWDVCPTAGTANKFAWKQSAWVSFVKDTMFKRQIVAQVMSGMKEANAVQIKAITEELVKQREAPPTSRNNGSEQKVESSLRSLINRMPSMVRADVYSLVKTRLDHTGGVKSTPEALQYDALVRMVRRQGIMLWFLCMVVCVNTVILFGVNHVC